MSIKVVYNSQLISLLNSIFYPSPLEKDEFLPIIKDMKKIPNIIPFINLDKNIKINLDNTISLIFYLKNLFSENNDLIPLFIKNCLNNNKNLIKRLIDLYIDEKVEGQGLEIIEDLIYNINFNVSICKNIFEYIYQQLNKYFNINQKKKSENSPILTEPLLLRYLKLLNIFYTDLKKENEMAEKTNKIEDKIIRNYFYFNGINSGMTIILNKSSNNLNIDSPSLVEGCSIIFYINLDKDLLDNYFQTILKKTNINVNLIKLLIGTHVISLELEDSGHISIIIDNTKSNIINISDAFKYNVWNCIMFLLEPKSVKKKKFNKNIC